MSGVDYATMKQLLDDQSRTILSEIKSHVKAEVTAQLGPHVSRVDQLYDDQAQIRKQLSDITTLLKNPTPSSEVPTPATTAPSSPFPSDHQHLQHLSNHDIENITSARHKLHFSLISTDDLERLKNNPSEDVSLDELLNRALHEYLEVNMGIPTSTIARMDIKQITHGQEIDFETATVEFVSMSAVNTVFKYVKNLAPEQQVSIVVPTALVAKHEELKSWSFHLRNTEPKHKTVIKYIGNDLVMYAKKVGGQNWFLVNKPPHVHAHTQLGSVKRVRDDNLPSNTDPAKKSKQVYSSNSGPSPSAPALLLENPPSTSSGIPKPSIITVPCYSKPSPLQTSSGGFWPDVSRSPSLKKANQLENSNA